MSRLTCLNGCGHRSGRSLAMPRWSRVLPLPPVLLRQGVIVVDPHLHITGFNHRHADVAVMHEGLAVEAVAHSCFEFGVLRFERRFRAGHDARPSGSAIEASSAQRAVSLSRISPGKDRALCWARSK